MDLCTGDKHKVLSVTKNKDHTPDFPHVPEDVVHTLSAGRCTDDELTRIRKRDRYTVTENCSPFLDVSIA